MQNFEFISENANPKANQTRIRRHVMRDFARQKRLRSVEEYQSEKRQRSSATQEREPPNSHLVRHKRTTPVQSHGITGETTLPVHESAAGGDVEEIAVQQDAPSTMA